jgi:hypothetical protein
MCCQGAPYIDGLTLTLSGASEADVSPSFNETDTTGPSLEILPNEPMTELEVEVLDSHHPMWFGTDAGWTGTTYDEAKAFCESYDSVGGGTLHLCPLSAFCPDGPTNIKPLYLQMDAFEGVQWSPISNSFNGWVMVGKFDDKDPLTCLTHMQMFNHNPAWGLDGSKPELKEHLLCCEGYTAYEDVPPEVVISDSVANEDGNDSNGSSSTEAPSDGIVSTSDAGESKEESVSISMTALEAQILVTHHPVWLNSDLGWQGTTYDDAKAFCESISDTLHLCPLDAYCPNGPRDIKPLYLHLDSFEGVQWAPISDSFNAWIMVGKFEEEDPLTCVTHMQMFNHNPGWGLDGSKPELKEHILCCDDNSSSESVDEAGMPDAGSFVDSDSPNSNSEGGHEGSAMVDGGKYTLEASIMNTFNPAWFSADQGGWDGGSHDDAIRFCEKFTGSHGKSMELCPYRAYCPQGPSKPVIEGHGADFDKEGEQWAPVYGQANHWVLIGKRGTDVSTTCQSHAQLTGEEPLWGLDYSNKEVKKYVMCCSPT